MKIKELNGLNVINNKQLELILAIQSIFIRNNKDYKEEFDFISVPPIEYLNELNDIINSVDHQDIINDLIEFKDASECIEIALSLNDVYELDNNKINLDKINKYLGNVDLNDFVNRLKKYAINIKWDDFYNNHIHFYQDLYSNFCDFPRNFDLNDINQFYNTNKTNYNYIPSILMNGGFGIEDKEHNNYYIRGIEWWDRRNSFYYDKEYLLECLFHEFSHPIINPLVDKYYNYFTNIIEFQTEAINNGLPRCYSNNPKVLLYEYIVRCNANVLTKKYYKDCEISDWIIDHGFTYLNDLIDYTMKNIFKYDSYEDFFRNSLINYIDNIYIKNKQEGRK